MIFAVLGGLLLIAGVVVLIGRRRLQRNLNRAGLVPETSGLSTLYAFGIAATQILLGILFVFLALVSSQRERNAEITTLPLAISMKLGPWFAPLTALLILVAVISIWTGAALIGRAWESRRTWGETGDLRIPNSDRARIVLGTVVGACGIVALVGSGLLVIGAVTS